MLDIDSGIWYNVVVKQWINKDHKPGKGAKQDKHRRHQSKCNAYKKAGLREKHKLFHLMKHTEKNPNDLIGLKALKALKDAFIKSPIHRGLGLGYLKMKY